ncbi:MAG: cobalamin B12-binding domain-containing protein [Dehalococcoidia bacterium]|nr:cobalamin B12-binding domain-containing protein [Dehalococcoidia bacterium]
MTGEKVIRVLIAKAGLDGHDRGAIVVARSLREAGMEVTYSGIRHTPETIIDMAVRDGVDVLGLSSLSGAHMEHFPIILQGLKERGMEHVLVMAGGVIPGEDVDALREMGVEGIFGPGTVTKEIIGFVQNTVEKRRTAPS